MEKAPIYFRVTDINQKYFIDFHIEYFFLVASYSKIQNTFVKAMAITRRDKPFSIEISHFSE